MNLNLDYATLHTALLNLIMIVISLSLHEWGHAWMADRLGDDTPRLQGRVTLYPPAHIDPIGTLLIPFLCSLGIFGSFGVIGWAKPVIINPNNFKHRTRDSAWVTIAGPAMNVLIALFATFAAALAHRFAPIATSFLISMISMNVLLMVFNLLPVPPLDGSKFLMYWFGMSEEAYVSFARWGWIALMLAINLPPFRMMLSTLYYYAMGPFATLYGILGGR
jgi:Zn-dependent protease